MELAGLCDRVLVFSRGRVIRELTGDEITEESIVSSFLRSKEVAASAKRRARRRRHDRFSLESLRQLVAGGSNQWWVPLLFLLLLTLAVGAYAGAADRRLPHAAQYSPHPARDRAAGAGDDGAVQRADGARASTFPSARSMSLIVVVASFLIAEDIGAGLIAVRRRSSALPSACWSG